MSEDALREEVAQLREKAAENETKLQVWKTRARDKITELEGTIEQMEGEAEQFGEKEKRFEIWKERACGKIREMEDKLKQQPDTSPEDQARLQQALEEKVAQLREAQSRGEESRAEAAALSSRMKEEQAAVAETISEQATRLQTLQQQVKAAEAARGALEQQLQQERVDAQRSAEGGESAQAVLREELAEAHAARQAAERQTNALQKDAARMEAEIAQHTASAAAAKEAAARTGESTSSQLADALGAAAAAQEKSRGLAAQLDALAAEKAGLEAQAAAAKKALEEKGIEAKRLEGEIGSLQSRVEDLAFLEEMQESKPAHSDAEFEAQAKASATLRKRVAQLEAENADLASDLEKRGGEAAALQAGTEELRHKFQLFRQRAKEQREKEQQEAEDRLQELHHQCDDEREKVRRRDEEILSLQARQDTTEQQVAELERQVAEHAVQFDEADAALQEARSSADGYREEVAMSEANYQVRLDQALLDAGSQHQLAMADLSRELNGKLSASKEQQDEELVQRIASLEDRLDQARKELKSARDQAARSAEEKERDAILHGRTAAELKKRIADLEAGGDPLVGSFKSLGSQPLGGSSQGLGSAAADEKFGSADFGRDMMFLAQQQASRDYEMQSLRNEVASLGKKVAEVTRQRDHNMERVNELSKMKNEQRASDSRGKLNMDYLKNILVKFIAEKNRTVQANLVPVLATMLELNSEEKTVLRKEFPSAKLL